MRLRERIHPGHPSVRYDARTLSRSDLPANSAAVVRMTHGTDVLLEIMPDTTIMTGRGALIWVNYHMMVVLFDAGAHVGPDEKSMLNIAQSDSTYA
jgi:hypothetical protein